MMRLARDESRSMDVMIARTLAKHHFCKFFTFSVVFCMAIINDSDNIRYNVNYGSGSINMVLALRQQYTCPTCINIS